MPPDRPRRNRRDIVRAAYVGKIYMSRKCREYILKAVYYTELSERMKNGGSRLMALVKQSIWECWQERVAKTPEDVFLRFEQETYSWKEMDEIVEGFAVVLLEAGVEKQSRVGIFGLNSPGWAAAFLAVQKIGAVAILINSYYKDAELEDCIDIASIEHILYSGESRSPEIADVMGKMEDWVQRTSLDIEKTFSEVRKSSKYKKIEEEVSCGADELCCILFTSGTTNDCKGVRFSHFSLINNAREVVKRMRWTEEDRMCLTVPLFHCFGITISFLASIIGGMSISLLAKYRTVQVCEAVQQDRCTILNGVPSMFLALIRNPQRAEYDLSSLKSGIIAGSPIYENEYLDICENLGAIRLQPSYGLTEASPCVTIVDYDDPLAKKAVSAGKVIDEVEIRIVDICSGQELERGKVGEIHVRGYNVTSGYLTLGEDSCSALSVDGWLKTGDLGYLDAEGCLYITGRRKNLIIRGGENVSPHEIERFIKEAAEGIEVLVFGVRTEVMQEEIVACIESREDLELEHKIRYYLAEHLSHFKIPKYFVFIEEFPRNSTGKINQKKLKDSAETRLKTL